MSDEKVVEEAAKGQEGGESEQPASKGRASKFDPKKPYGTVHGSPGTAFFQKGQYYNADGKPSKGPV